MIPGRCIKCRRRAMSIYSAYCSRCAPPLQNVSDPAKAFVFMLVAATTCFLLGLVVLIVNG